MGASSHSSHEADENRLMSKFHVVLDSSLKQLTVSLLEINACDSDILATYVCNHMYFLFNFVHYRMKYILST